MLQRNPDQPTSKPRSYHPFYVRGGMSYSNSSYHDYDATNGASSSSAATSQMNVTRIDGDARQLTAEEYRKVHLLLSCSSDSMKTD